MNRGELPLADPLSDVRFHNSVDRNSVKAMFAPILLVLGMLEGFVSRKASWAAAPSLLVDFNQPAGS